MAVAAKTKWIPITTDESFNNIEIGETICEEAEQVIGRTLSISLMELTNDMKKQSVNVKFRINSINGQKAVANPVAIEVLPSAIKRQVRRKRTKIDDSFVCKTADGKMVRVKPFLVTVSNTKNSTTKALRKSQRYLLAKVIEKITYHTLVKDLVSGKLQNYVDSQINSIYPLKAWDIRYLGLESAPVEGEGQVNLISSKDYAAEDVIKKMFAAKRERKRKTTKMEDQAPKEMKHEQAETKQESDESDEE